MKKILNLSLVLALFCLFACNNEEKPGFTQNKNIKSDTNVVAEKPPIIQLEDSMALPRFVICMSDSSNSVEGVAQKFKNIFEKIKAEYFVKNKINPTGPPTAWYKSNGAPYFFEVGMPSSKNPAVLPNKMFLKEIKADSVSVAHFYGPNEQLEKGYNALIDWMKDHGHKAKGAPYEIYVDDPVDSTGKAKDPHKVRTDIVIHF